MPAYEIQLRHYKFTRWYNHYYGTNFSEHQGVPSREFDAALRMLNMEMVGFPGGGTSHASYVLRASDGGKMAQQTGLDGEW